MHGGFGAGLWLAAVGLLFFGCDESHPGGDGEVDGPGAVVGSWTARGGLYLCVEADGRARLGDSPEDLVGPAPCQVRFDEGTLECADPDDGPWTAVLTPGADGTLELSIRDCIYEPPECAAVYERDPDNPCAPTAGSGEGGARAPGDAG